jgi:hypothetical protein
MLPRYRGLAGEYIWDKEMERLERYKDRPWELQSREAAGSPLFVSLFVVVAMVAGLLVFSLF